MIAIVEKALSKYTKICFVEITPEHEPLLKVMDVLGTTDFINWKQKLSKGNKLALVETVVPGSFFAYYSWKDSLPYWEITDRNRTTKIYPSGKALNLDDQCLSLVLKVWKEYCNKSKLTFLQKERIKIQEPFVEILSKPDFLSTIAITEIIT